MWKLSAFSAGAPRARSAGEPEDARLAGGSESSKSGSASAGRPTRKALRGRRPGQFLDMSGLSRRLHQVRIWAPRGQAPAPEASFNWKALFAAAGVTFRDSCFQPGSRSIGRRKWWIPETRGTARSGRPRRADPGPIAGASPPPAASIRRGAADGSRSGFALLLDRTVRMAPEKMKRIRKRMEPVFWKRAELCFE